MAYNLKSLKNNNNLNMSNSNVRSTYLDVFRILLVLAIFLYHLDVLTYGYLAVDGFIILAGFLSSVVIRREGVLNFLKRRYVRIYLPLISLFLIIFSSSFFIWPNWTSMFMKSIFQTAFLYFDNTAKHLGYFDITQFYPGLYLWSLSAEIKFYIAVAIIYGLLQIKYFNKTKIESSLIYIIILIFIIIYSQFFIKEKLDYMDLEWRFPQFLVGFSIYEIIRKFQNNNKIIGLWTLVLISSLIQVFSYSSIHLFISILTIMVIILNFYLKTPKSSTLLGNVSYNSYSFFLIHGVGISLASVIQVYFDVNDFFIVISFVLSLLLTMLLMFFTKIFMLTPRVSYLVAPILILFFYIQPNLPRFFQYDNRLKGDDSPIIQSKPDTNLHLYGDSHANMLIHGFNSTGRSIPVFGSDMFFQNVKTRDAVIVSFRWIGWEKWKKNEKIFTNDPRKVAQGLIKMVESKTNINKVKTVVIGAYPQINRFLPSPINLDCTKDRDVHYIHPYNLDYWIEFNSEFKKISLNKGFYFFDPIPFLVSNNNKLNGCFYFDNNHLSQLGAVSIVKKIMKFLEKEKIITFY